MRALLLLLPLNTLLSAFLGAAQSTRQVSVNASALSGQLKREIQGERSLNALVNIGFSISWQHPSVRIRVSRPLSYRARAPS